MPAQPISDEDLLKRCVIAIQEGHTKEALFMRLKSERKKISAERLSRLWAACGGIVRRHESW